MKNKKIISSILFVICFIIIAGVSFIGIKGATFGGWHFKSFEEAITKGLDLQGGVSVLMEIQSDKVTPEELQNTKESLSLRVNKVGVSETVVTTEGNNRIRIDIPGKFDSKSIVDVLGKTGELTFKDPEGKVLLTGKDVKKASAYLDQQTGKPVVGLELTDEGKKKFGDATQKLVGKQIGIYMDNEQLTNPTVQEPILDGKASISGNRSLEEAKKLSGVINAGALPLPVKTVSVKTVGAQLGTTALPNALKAGAIGIGIIFLFMIFYYRVPGFLACIALTLYINLVLYAFVSLGAVLTLPGIAGFLLTIGMAVDANVLIFERTREELRNGKSIKASVNAGFHNAMSSIVDSNITTMITAVVLYFFGSGPVKGFATTLMIGIVISMFTAIIVTRFLVNLALNMGLLNKPSLFGVKRG